jgi:serine/threonine protein kinase/tetratricopeptide (TPR) repeat protein
VKNVDSIYLAARELPPKDRPAYLAKVCADDQALRKRVEQMLAVAAEAEAFITDPQDEETTVDEPGPEPAKTAAREMPDEVIGQKIGRYKILERVGEGGCGVVYVAEQTEPVRRRVALKVIKLGMDTKQVVARFEAERQALAMMDHPNIARVLDGGATDNGRPYFVMELVRGIKITDYCDQASLPTKDRLDLFIQVCHAIQHAHQKGIIHRDIKPSNILVTLNDGVPVPKVIDFGIAKATEGRLTDATVYTQLHQFIGTPAYMSPEQAEMSSLDIDTRSDIYSLGVMLYELLAGTTPFDARELMSLGVDAMRKAIREKEPVRPSTRLATLQRDELTTTAKRRAVEAPRLIHLLKGDLDWIVMKCLEKDRTRRYETANGLAADLKRHLSSEPVVARPPSKLYEFQKLVRRHKVGFAATAAVILALTTGVVVSAWEAVRARQAEKLAKERLVEVGKERDAKELARQDAEAISKFLSEVFQSPDPARDGRTITVAETLDKASKKLESDLATQPARRAKLQATLGSTYFALGLYGQAILPQEKVRDYYLATFGEQHPETLTATHNLATSYFNVGRRDEALRLREEVLILRRKVLGPEAPDTLTAMHNLAVSCASAGRPDEALKLRQEVLTLRRRVLGPEHPDTLRAMNNLALSCSREEALKLYEELLPLCRKVLGSEHPNTIGVMHNLAADYFAAGRREEALKLREEVLPLRRKVNGPEHPETLMAISGLAASYEAAGRREEALKLSEDLLPLSRKVNGPEQPDTIWAMHNLAIFYFDAGRRDDALKLREEVLALRRKVNGAEHSDTIWAMHNLAISYFDAGRRDEALKLREEVLALRRKVLGPEDPDTLSAMDNLASSYFNASRQDEALKLREEVLTFRRKVNGPEHPDTISAMDSLGDSCFDAGRRNEALKLREEALMLHRKVLGPEHRDTFWAMHNLAISYFDAGRRDEALRLREEMLALRRKVLGPVHLDTLSAMDYLAISYYAAGRRDEALKLREEVLALRRKVLGPAHPDTLWAMDNLASSYDHTGRREEALKLYEEVLTLRRKALGPEHPATVASLNSLAWFLATSDSATLRNGTNAVQLAEAAVTATSRKNLNYLDTLATAYAETQQFDKAVAVEQEAIALCQTEAQKKAAGSHLELYQVNQPYHEQRNP